MTKQWFGAYHATVTNNADPKQKNRVQLQVPQVLGAAVSHWATPLALVQSPPTPGTKVIAMFAGGEISHPLYIMETESAAGAVTSVNGQTGTVVLTAAALGAVPTSDLPISVANGGTGAGTAAAARANLGAAQIFLQTTTPASANAGDIWIDNFYGDNTVGLQQYNGTSWTVLEWGSGAVGFLPLSIANGGTGANTATAALTALGGAALAGAAFTGAVTAPSVNVNGGKAGNAFAVAGNTDFNGPVFIEDQSAPITPGTSTALWSASGHLKYNAEDGNTYDTGVKHVVAYPFQTVTSTSFINVTGASTAVAAMHYRFKALLIVSENSNTTGTPQFQFSCPATTGDAGVFFEYLKNNGSGTTLARDNTFTTSVTTLSVAAGPTFSSQGQIVEIEGDATFSVAGTLQLQGLVSANSMIVQAVYIDLYPVV